MSLRSTLTASLIAVVTLGGCERKQPTQPDSFAITGRVRLDGHFIDAAGRPGEARRVHDADGVRVELIRGENVVAQTATTDGVYRFDRLAAGAYQMRVRVGFALEDVTRQVTIATHDVTVLDTLVLVSAGDLYPVPNPVVDSTHIFYEIPDDVHVDIRILDLWGNTVSVLVDRVVDGGLRSVIWNGRSDTGLLAGDRHYWVTFTAADRGDFRAQLLYR